MDIIKRCHQYFLVSLVLALCSNQLYSAEYSDKDIEPGISEIAFSKNAIGFISFSLYDRAPKIRKKHYFVLPRNQSLSQEVSQSKFFSLFSNTKSKDYVTVDSYLPTSDGTTYELIDYNMSMKCPWVSDISEYEKRNIRGPNGEMFQSIILSEKTISTPIHVCNQITALEHVNDQLWIGTGYGGDHGAHPGQGVIIQDRTTGAFIKKISGIESWTTKIRSDPFSDEIWIAASSIIMQMNKDGILISKYRFSSEFDSSSGLSTYVLSKKKRSTNPLAVIARNMTKNNAKRLYEVAKTIPEKDVQKFSLYGFYMCCNIGSDYYPRSMSELAPIMIDELIVLQKAGQLSSSIYTNRWVQTLCKLQHPAVHIFFKSVAMKSTKYPLQLINSCIKKLENQSRVSKGQTLRDPHEYSSYRSLRGNT